MDSIDSKQILFQGLKNNIGLNALLDLACQHLDNPVCLVDSSYQLLHVSGDEPDDSIFYVDNQHYFIKDELISEFQSTHFTEEIMGAGHAYRGTQKSGKKEQLLLCPVRINHIMLAFICVLPTRRAHTNDDLKYVDYLSDILSLEMQKNKIYSEKRGFQHEFFIENLLNNSFTSEASIQSRLSVIGWKKRSYYVIASFSLSNRAELSFDSGRIAHQLRNLFQDAFIVFFSGCPYSAVWFRRLDRIC